jgi:hypothetical protein
VLKSNTKDNNAAKAKKAFFLSSPRPCHHRFGSTNCRLILLVAQEADEQNHPNSSPPFLRVRLSAAVVASIVVSVIVSVVASKCLIGKTLITVILPFP